MGSLLSFFRQSVDEGVELPSKTKVSINCSCFHSNNYIDENDGGGDEGERKGVL